MRNFLSKLLRVIKWIAIIAVVLVAIILIGINTSAFQEFVLRKGVDFFDQKTGAQTTVGELDLYLPRGLSIYNLELTYPNSGQVSRFDELHVEINWKSLFDNTISLESVEINGLNAQVIRFKNGGWDFDFIAESFAPDSEEVDEPVSDTQPWDFTLGSAQITESKLLYVDRTSGDSMDFSIGKLKVSVDELSTLTSTYRADEIQFNRSNVWIGIGTSPDSTSSGAETDSESIAIDVGVNKLSLNQNKIGYSGSPEELYAIEVGSIDVEVEKLDLDQLVFHIPKVKISETHADFTLAESTDTTSTTSIFAPIELKVDNFDMSENSIRVNQSGNTSLSISRLGLSISDIEVNPSLYAAQIKSAQLIYNDTLKLSALSGGLILDEKSATIKELEVQSMDSRLNLDGQINFADIALVMDSLEFIDFDIRKLDATIDPALINPFIPDSLGIELANNIELYTKASGTREQFNISKANLKIGQSEVKTVGVIDLKDLKNPGLKIDTLHIEMFRSDIILFTANAGIDTAMVPEEIAVNGHATYFKNEINTRLKVESSLGMLTMMGNGSRSTEGMKVTFDLEGDSIDLHRLTQVDQLQDIDFEADGSFEQKGDYRAGTLNFHTDELTLEDKRLKGVDIYAELNNDSLHSTLQIRDSALISDFTFRANLSDSATYQLVGDIEGVDFQLLGLTAEDVRSTFHIEADYNQTDEFQRANLKIDDIIVLKSGNRLELDSLYADIFISPDSTNARLQTNMLEMESVSNRTPQEISKAIAKMIANGKLELQDSTAYWKARLKARDSKDIREVFFPKLKEFKTAEAQINYNPKEKDLSMNFILPRVQYDDIEVDSLSVIMEGDSDGVRAELLIEQVTIDSLGVQHISLSSMSTRKETLLEFAIRDEEDSLKYHFDTQVLRARTDIEDKLEVRLISPLILNYESWTLNDSNRIAIGPEKFEIENFEISKGKDQLSVRKPLDEEVINFTASSFDLGYVSNIFTSSAPLATGELFGSLSYNLNGSFSGSGRIDDLTLLDVGMGHFTWETSNENQAYAILVGTDGDDLKMKANGTFRNVDAKDPDINVTVNIDRLEMAALTRVVPEYLSEGSGAINGVMSVEGTVAKPVVKGNLNFNDVAFRLSANGELYKINNQRLELSSGLIQFKDFTIRDSFDNKLFLSGKVTHEYFQDFQTDFRIRSENFGLLNVTAEENSSLYGKMLASTDISVKGPALSPKIEAEVHILDKTEVTYTVPESDFDEELNEDLITWTDFDLSEDEVILTREKENVIQSNQYVSNAVELTGGLFIDENAIFRVIIDSLAGDYLEIKGGGQIGASYDRAGNIRLNGTYMVKDGFYKMTFYNIAKRTFNFQKGSSVTWNGDPMEATVEITAMYRTNANVANLMSVSGNSAAAESFQEQLPFEVVMKMSGDLLSPNIEFSIRLPDDRRGAFGGAVEARLNELAQDENELNKQVFALLVLNTFITSDSNSDQNLVQNQARNSASQILSQQLNSLSDQYISGVDVNFDLQSYEVAAGQGNTDLNIDIEKAFLDDRMVVKVGSTIAIEDNSVNARSDERVMTNVSVEYKLTPDGRYRFKVYSKTDLEDIVVGRITRTGAGVVFQRDFDRLDQIFEKPKENEVEQEEEDEKKEE